VTWPQRLLGVVFLTSGVLHFLRPDVYEQIMPGYVPAHHELVLASGAAEIAGAVAVAFPRTRSAAGLWLAAVLVAVFPANVHMALHPGRYPSLPAALLWARLPLQPLLVWWAVGVTRGRAGGES
jgi:uncharacterized membrane protein